ncbi:MAG: M1 family metallopeptidase, partial [Terriglobales bacterium]
MWFGDLVTMEWWDDIWLNEGFATWATNKPLRQWRPEWNREMNDVQSTAAALARDSLANSRPVRKQAETPSEITELFDGVAYGKAASVLRMVETYVGEEDFRRGVETYLKKFSWGNASAEDFWNTVAQVSGKPVDRIMKRYVDQPGAPLVSIETSCRKGNTVVTASQQRFYYDSERLAEGSGELWQVPVCMKTPEGVERCELLTLARQEFSLPGCSGWVLANAGASGYYRTAYGANAREHIRRDSQKTLTPGERLLLLNDEWALMRAGRRSIGDYLALLDGFRGERMRAIVLEFTGRVEYIGDYLVEGSDRAAFEAWVSALLRPAAQELGWQPASGESDEVRSLRAIVLYTLGYSGRDAEVLAQARALAHRYLDDPKSVDATLADTALKLAASDGDAALYEKFLGRMEQAGEPEERERFMDAMTKFRDPALVKRSLEYAVSGRMRNQDAPLFLADLMENVPSQDVAWTFVKSNWTQVQATFTPASGAYLVGATSYFCDAGSRDQAAQFFADHPVQASERTLRRAQETINN